MTPATTDWCPPRDSTSPNARPEPGSHDEQPVPADLTNVGHDTATTTDDDSPESLDEDITQGANREDIDPHHSYDRPAVDTIDEEENGVN